MAASYQISAQRAVSRMVRMLFRPFRLEFWMVLGFSAFLSEYLSHPGGSGSSWQRHAAGHGIPAPARRVAEFLLHPVWGPLILALVIAAIIGVLLFTWVSCRGKFIFLENVALERAAIVDPWRRFKRHGNSLFAFWFVMTVVVVAIAIGISLPLLPPLLHTVASGEDWQLLVAEIAVWWLAAMLPFVLLAACTYLFLYQFVVPIMYRDDLGVLAAWRRFLSLFADHKASFIGFAFFFLILTAVVASAILFAGVATCCLGFLLLAIPYVGSVILLPLEVTLRGLGPDFLAQYGPEWSIYEKRAASPAIGAPPGAGTSPPTIAPPTSTSPPANPGGGSAA